MIFNSIIYLLMNYFIFYFYFIILKKNFDNILKRLMYNVIIFFININKVYVTIIICGFSFSNLFNTTSTFLIAQVTLQNFIKQL